MRKVIDSIKSVHGVYMQHKSGEPDKIEMKAKRVVEEGKKIEGKIKEKFTTLNGDDNLWLTIIPGTKKGARLC